ncbi:MAG TPA: STAS domain-containing protein [Candidatus Methanoperedens sp.]|nr:STAS domain-containing protein [Candidatus Methanoperedens sp.]
MKAREDCCRGEAVVTLAGRLTVAEGVRCREVLLGALAAAPRVAVAFGVVESADLSVLQLLCAAHRGAAAAGAGIALAGEAPPAVARLAARVGTVRCPEALPGCLVEALCNAASREAEAP